MAVNYNDAIINKVSEYQEQLEKEGFYGIDSTILKVASGLRN